MSEAAVAENTYGDSVSRQRAFVDPRRPDPPLCALRLSVPSMIVDEANSRLIHTSALRALLVHGPSYGAGRLLHPSRQLQLVPFVC